MGQLTSKYDYDESFFDERLYTVDLGRLTVSVLTDQFSGKGGFWVHWQDVKRFGESLSTFPITSDKPLKPEWGYNTMEGDDLILGVMISPANATGDLLVTVRIADDQEPSRRVCTSFLTNYPDLEAFRLSIARLMDRKLNEAILRGQ